MIKEQEIPRHIAIIMDGNGRWAKRHGFPRIAGHRRGIQVIEEIVEAAGHLGIKVLSLYAFSTENWRRPKKEIDMLLNALSNFLRHKLNKLIKNNIRLVVMGEIERFPSNVMDQLIDAQQKTKNNSGLIVNLALNYGSRDEIVRASRQIAEKAKSGQLDIENLDEQEFSKFLYTKDLPDVDLLIRTSGELRISNFMLWQLSYAELYFPKKFWPDFTKSDLKEAIKEFQKRERRFGDIYAHAQDN